MIARAHSRTRPTLVTTTFSSFCGVRLLELRRYFIRDNRHIWPTRSRLFKYAIGDLFSFITPSKVSSLNVTIIFFAGALTSEEKIVQSTCHVSVVSPARSDYRITPSTLCEFVLWPSADVNSRNFCNSNNILLGWPVQIAYSIALSITIISMIHNNNNNNNYNNKPLFNTHKKELYTVLHLKELKRNLYLNIC